jgi:hypothetical protein
LNPNQAEAEAEAEPKPHPQPGLEKAKSLLTLRDRMTFLDFIAKQTLYMRKK